jgi:hypothetical protein
MSMIERRNDRTNNPWLATSHYLTAVAERTGLDALVLASREGLSLSSADPHGRPSYLIATGTWADLTEEIQWAIDRIFGAPRHGLPN